MSETRVSFVADGLRLEGWLASPPNARAAAVICHPHPEYGGDMDNNVVVGVTRRLREAGAATLRFNFRGVGASGGSYSGTFAETADLRAAAAFLAAESGRERISLVGYSFGAMVVALVAADEERAERLALIALPATMFDPAPLERCALPKLLLHGDRDRFCSPGTLQDLVSRLPGQNELRVLAGADHFFVDRESELGDEIVRFLGQEGGR